MLFSSAIKDELTRRIPENACCMMAELSAFIHVIGSIHITTGEERRISLQIRSESPGLVRKIFSLLKNAFNIHPEISYYKRMRLRKCNLYVIKVSGKSIVKRILSSLYLTIGDDLRLNRGLPLKLLSSDCCRRSYISALFVAAGSVVTPEKNYHLEIVVEDLEYTKALMKLLEKYDVRLKISQRKGKWVLYLKDAEEIVQFLAVMQVHKAVLDFENVRVLKDVRNQINRLVNCETANLSKSAYASMEQINDIHLIEENLVFKELPKNLQETARLRLEYPYMNMRELAEMHSPPLTKSGVNYRIRRLQSIAEDLRNKKM